MAAKLHLVFSQGTSSKTLTVNQPNENLTKAQVQQVMEDIVNRKALLAKEKPVDGIKKAYLSDVKITELAVA